MVEEFDETEEATIMVILAVKEEIILSALLMLEGTSSGAPLRKRVIELSQKEIVSWDPVQSPGWCLSAKAMSRPKKASPHRSRGEEAKPYIPLRKKANKPFGRPCHCMLISKKACLNSNQGDKSCAPLKKEKRPGFPESC